LTNVRKKRNRARWVTAITIWTFFLAIVFGFLAHLSLNEIQSITISFFILIFVIMIGIVFDIIGTAATAAGIAPLNAKAACKVDGAKRGVYLVKHAEKVANFCNDVAGDISGIISGTLATIIVFKLVVNFSYTQAEFYLGILLTALVAALTVGGKAWGKVIAINHSTEVIMLIGLIIDRLLKPLSWFGKRG
jgi:Mg2+/Co2+ transporter CorB